MSSPYPILENRPIDQWKVTELREELKRRKLTTKGLKEDLVKRLDEALRSEQESEQGNTGDGFDSAPESKVESEKEKTELFDANKEKDAPAACDSIGDKVESEVHKVDLGDNRTPSDDGKVVEGEQVHSIGEEVGQHSNVETNVVVGETVDSAMALDGQDSQNQGIQNEGDSKTELQNPGSESSDVNAKIVSPKRNNQKSMLSLRWCIYHPAMLFLAVNLIQWMLKSHLTTSYLWSKAALTKLMTIEIQVHLKSCIQGKSLLMIPWRQMCLRVNRSILRWILRKMEIMWKQ